MQRSWHEKSLVILIVLSKRRMINPNKVAMKPPKKRTNNPRSLKPEAVVNAGAVKPRQKLLLNPLEERAGARPGSQCHQKTIWRRTWKILTKLLIL